MEIRRYWKVLLKRKWIFLIILIIPLLFAYALSKAVTPVYFSQAKVWIRSDTLQQGFIAEIPSGLGKLDFVKSDNAMGSIEEIFESRPVVGTVISDMGLKNKKGNPYKIGEFIDVGALGLLSQKRGVDIENLSDSEVFKIVGYSDKPDEAREIAERVIKNFKVEFAKIFKNSVNMALETSKKRLKEIGEELSRAEKEVSDYRTKNDVYNISTQITTLITEIMNLQAELDLTDRNIASARASLQVIKDAIAAQPEFKQAQMTTEVNPIITEAKKSLLALETDLAKLSGERTAEHPDVKADMKVVEALKAKIKGEVAKTMSSQLEQRNTYYDTLVAKYGDAEIQIITSTAVRNTLLEQMTEKRLRLKALPLKEEEYNSLTRKADNLKTVYNKIDAAKQFMFTAIDMDPENGVTIEPPTLSANMKANTYFPTNKKALYYMGSLFAGFFMGMAGVFLLDYIDDTVEGADDVKRTLGEKVLAVLPEVKKGQFNNINTFIPPLFNSGVRDMIANLRLIKDAPLKVVSIVGSGKGEGKTLLAGLTAAALAFDGKKTLIIDANLRNPCAHNLFGIINSKGLADILEDNAPGRDVIKAAPLKNLSILTAGRPVEHPLGLLSSEKLEAVIKTLSSDFDKIIIDTASLDAGLDALMLSKYADEVVFVVAQDRTSHKKAKNCLELMRAARLEIRGVVVNREASIYSWSWKI